YILENLVKTLKAAGTSLEHVVKAQVFVTDLDNFFGFDEVWREFFATPPPRTTVGTTGLLVKDTLVEIDVVAALPSARAQQIAVPDIPRPLAHYTPATRVGDLVFAAGARPIAAPTDVRHHRVARQGHAGGDRRGRGAAVGAGPAERRPRHPTAARPLHAGHARGRSRVLGGPDRLRLHVRRAGRLTCSRWRSGP